MNKELLEEKVASIEEIIYGYLPCEEGKQRDLIEAMNYSIKAGGKRLRPMLMMETALLFNDDMEDVKGFMAAIECIHTYSLVHDDLPAMDNDEYRRGKLTTHKKYGHAAGILAGDGLLNYAYEIISETMIKSKNIERCGKAFREMAFCAGIFGMVGGQAVDVALTGQRINEDTLEFIYSLKTGALIEASMVTGAILAGADEEEIETVKKISLLIGRAFQIRDDILDITSTTEVLGKPVLSDEKNNKTTYATLYGIDKANEEVRRLTDEALLLFDKLPGNKAFIKDLFEMLVARNK